MARKTSGSLCGRTGSQIGSSNPSTISSITAATLGTPSSISLGKSRPSRAATGQPWVTQCEYWYKTKDNTADAESTSSEPKGQELGYAARISLDRTQIQVEDRLASLSPGM